MELLRLFIAIKLPQDFTKKLINYQIFLNNPIFKLTTSQNLHLTLLFLGDIPKTQIPNLKHIIQQNIVNFKPAPIIFKTISYGPYPQVPRLVWLTGTTSESYNNLKKTISEQITRELSLDKFNDLYDFIPHITLARLKNNIHQPLPELPHHDIFNNYSFTPNRIWLEQSILKKEGPQYIDLEEFNL
ncbi:MAG: RNA 2',3'-cyclic phosphodiesterase [Parcubacteria group bacterium]|nr:RNA 2',3'-cyclic phosphodiesterase [Parcubacteria group bacterium]